MIGRPVLVPRRVDAGPTPVTEERIRAALGARRVNQRRVANDLLVAELLKLGLSRGFFTKKRTRGRRAAYRRAFYSLRDDVLREAARRRWGLP